MRPPQPEASFPPRTIALGLVCLALNLALSLTAPESAIAFAIMVVATLAFLVAECALSRSAERCSIAGLLAWVLFFGPAGLAMILAETLNVWAAVLGVLCILVIGGVYFGALVEKAASWWFRRRW